MYFFQPVGARWKLILRYMVNNDHIKLSQKYQPCGCVAAGNIGKFTFRGHPTTYPLPRTSLFFQIFFEYL